MFYNWHVIGHQKELSSLEHDIRNDSISHAYLFVGASKIGKFRVAKSMAGILQCPNDYCRTCPSCIQVDKQSHADTMEFEDNGESFKIETVRQIIERLYKTAQSRYKIVLLENIERLTLDASHTLLKVLEEPPPKTVFLLTAQFTRNVIPTIISRVRVVPFKSPSLQLLTESLEKMFPETNKETRDIALFLAQGRSGHAIQLLQNTELFQETKDLYRQVEFLDQDASIATRMIYIQELTKDPAKPKVKDPAKIREFLSLTGHYFRQKMLTTTDKKKQQRAIEILEQLDTISELMKRNINSKLLLENLMLNL